MPRPASELTKNRRCVGAHLTPEQYAEWKRIGGQKWLREFLSSSAMFGRVHQAESFKKENVIESFGVAYKNAYQEDRALGKPLTT
jgi:hypothetical protein